MAEILTETCTKCLSLNCWKCFCLCLSPAKTFRFSGRPTQTLLIDCKRCESNPTLLVRFPLSLDPFVNRIVINGQVESPISQLSTCVEPLIIHEFYNTSEMMDRITEQLSTVRKNADRDRQRVIAFH